jgi:hypothetical protein
MPIYELESKLYEHTLSAHLSAGTIDSLWQLFKAICNYWHNVPDPEEMKLNFYAFLANRISVDSNYINEYTNAHEVIDELVKMHGEDAAFEVLFTYKDIQQPNKIARAKSLVVNELITLQVALGGFKPFGNALNYPGYFGGANIKGHTPYRPY